MNVRHLSIARRSGFALLGVTLASASAVAQTGNEWLGFARDDARLSAPSNVGLADTEEKDYAHADLNNDGWVDLVCVRKQPGTSTGRRVNVLFMNENGVLTDRTAQYATATDVPGDNGFNTPTNDRDVVIADVNNDGWQDVITATTLTANATKALSHPRIYINLGDDASGNWLGLRFENDRIPQLLLANGTASFPRFCGVDAGDVTGDGFVELYFSDYDQGGSGGGDYNDRLLINDGTGYFTDESSLRMTAQMLQSDFGTNTQIVDLNSDGALDIVKDSGLINQHIAMSYNDPGMMGYFDLYQEPYNGAPYHVVVGDLNNDNLPDFVASDDGNDAFQYNMGNDPFGRVVWGPRRTFSYATNQGDDGFGSDSYIVDLDNDGWNEVIIADVDVDLYDCVRRTHIYHNRGGAVGSEIIPYEEAQFSNSSGWKGVVGMTGNDLRATHDVAIFDLDRDGDKDMIFGRCFGTFVWVNDLIEPISSSYCGSVPNSSGQGAIIMPSGSPVSGDNDFALTAFSLPENQFGYFLASMTPGFIANPGGAQGNLCLGGNIGRFQTQVQNSGPTGTFSIAVDLTQIPVSPTQAVMMGDVWHFQAWFRDLNPGVTSNFSDASTVTFQ